MATFLLLVFALSVPFWLLGALTGLQLVEGLPVAALMASNLGSHFDPGPPA